MRVTLVDGDLPEDVARAIRASGRAAVDTETSGLDWRVDELQVCQLYTPTTGPVLLQNVGSRPAQLASVLTDPGVVKVFHYAPFDLRFLEAKWGIMCEAVECTKTASRLLEPSLPAKEHSLQALLARHLGVSVDKGFVRTSNWGAATLSDEQIAYAIGDVDHLLALASVLQGALESAGLAELYGRVCAYLPVDAHLEVVGVPNPLNY